MLHKGGFIGHVIEEVSK